MNDYWNKTNYAQASQSQQAPAAPQEGYDSPFNSYWDQESPGMSGTSAQDVNGAQGPSGGTSSAPKATGAAAMTGNPYAIGAAMAFDAYQSYQQRQEQERQAEYAAKVEKIRGMQQSLGNAAQAAGRISYT